MNKYSYVDNGEDGCMVYISWEENGRHCELFCTTNTKERAFDIVVAMNMLTLVRDKIKQ